MNMLSGMIAARYARNDPERLKSALSIISLTAIPIDEAEVSFDRALAIAEQAVGPEHTDYAIVLNNIALLRKQQQRYAECESLTRRTIEIWERAVGPEHRLVAQGLHNLASLYEKMGRDEESEPLYRRALAVREKSIGPDHPRTVSTRVALDELLNRLEEI